MARKTQEQSTEAAQEEKVKITQGMTLQVLSTSNTLIFLGRVEQLEHGSIRISDVNGQPVPPVMYNTEIKLNGFLPGTETSVCYGFVEGSTEYFWKIGKITGKKMRDNREFFRQKIAVDAQVMCVNRIFDAKRLVMDEGTFPCKLLDLSGGGVRMSTKANYMVGDWLFIKDAELLDGKQSFSFTCRVRRVEDGRRENTYGCEFEGLTEKEQDRLIEAVFLLQRQETRRRDDGRSL